MQQVDEIVQRALVEAHFRVECPHALKDLHAAGIQSPTNQRKEQNTQIVLPTYHCNILEVIMYVLLSLLFIFMQSGLQQAEGVDQS